MLRHSWTPQQMMVLASVCSKILERATISHDMWRRGRPGGGERERERERERGRVNWIQEKVSDYEPLLALVEVAEIIFVKYFLTGFTM